MRIDETKWYQASWVQKWMPRSWRVRLDRGYSIDGTEFKKERWKGIAFTTISLAVPLSLISYVIGFWMHWFDLGQGHMVFHYLNPMDQHHMRFLNLQYAVLPWKTKWCWVFLAGTILGGINLYRRSSARFNSMAYGQKGDNRLTTIEELEAQYPKIPDSKERYEGIGGIPISHYRNQYFIETATNNNLVFGISRSGKGETVIVPMIDIIARASEQCSMVLNDPKGELYASSKETLEKLGYEVQVLNLLDPLNGMSYNPLNVIKEAYLDGESDRVEDLTNTFSYTMFDDPNAGANAWVNQGAEAMCNGLILGLLEKCVKDNALDKFNLYNVGQMMTELATVKFDEEDQSENAKSYLDAYFDSLPEGNKAKAQYASINLSGGNGKRTIVASVIEGLRLYQLSSIARMTSEHSFSLKSLGFPKYLTVRFDPKLNLYRYRIDVILRDSKNHELFHEKVKPNLEGVASLNFNCLLNVGDTLEFRFQEPQKDKVVDHAKLYLIQGIDETTKNVDLLPLFSKIPWDAIQNVRMFYSEKPIAVFMVTPDYDPSKNQIASTFVDQVYDALMKNASVTRGKKCFRRVQFILDEFGNMPALSKLENKLTVCLGRNVLFTLVIQSSEQLYSVYGKSIGQIAKENCQNKLLIQTDNQETVEEFVKMVGNKTVEATSRDKQLNELKTSSHVSVSEEYLLPPERISYLTEGEMIVIRKLHRQDKERNKVRAYPIFNTGETEMPYRYEFLSKEYDMDKDIMDLDIHSDHQDINLDDIKIDFEQWRKEIREANGKADTSDLNDNSPQDTTEASDSSFGKGKLTQQDQDIKERWIGTYEIEDESFIQNIDTFLYQLNDMKEYSMNSLLESLSKFEQDDQVDSDLVQEMRDYAKEVRGKSE